MLNLLAANPKFRKKPKMELIDEINDFMLTTFQEKGVEDTTANRIAFLTGLQKAWKEDPDASIGKTLYQMALNSELMLLQIKLMFPKIME